MLNTIAAVRRVKGLVKSLEFVLDIVAMLYNLPEKARAIDWKEEVKKVGFALALLALLTFLTILFWAAYGPVLGLFVGGLSVATVVVLGAAISCGGPLPGERYQRDYERQ